ncbi:MAG TPA: hypothetical protein PLR90_09220 [Methylophilus sp.]|nr:hypothetical protein [Methylophilus sp.]HQQ34084.1 hypothetical protein [Methylophilus sp.]
MTPEERWSFLNALDDELLKGGVILSEWCSFVVCESDTAFANGAHLASIITAVSAIETYLKSEYPANKDDKLVALINQAEINSELKKDIHILRKYRNKWVHVDDPWNDENLLANRSQVEAELENMALFAAKTLRRTIYENQWV